MEIRFKTSEPVAKTLAAIMSHHGEGAWPMWLDQANDLIDKLKGFGLYIVSDSLTPEQLAAVLPNVNEPDDSEKKIGAAACLLLSGGEHINGEGNAVFVAAELLRDYRAIVRAQG